MKRNKTVRKLVVEAKSEGFREGYKTAPISKENVWKEHFQHLQRVVDNRDRTIEYLKADLTFANDRIEQLIHGALIIKGDRK